MKKDKIIGVRPLWRGNDLTVHTIIYTDVDGHPHITEFASPHGTPKDPRTITSESIGRRQAVAIALAFTPGKKRMLIAKRFRPAAGRCVYDLPACFIPREQTNAEAAELELWRQTNNVETSICRVLPPGYMDPDRTDARAGFVLFEVPENIELKAHKVDHEKITPMLVTPEELRKIVEEELASMVLHALALTWTPETNSTEKQESEGRTA